MRDSLQLVLGQGIWAVAQAVLLLYLARLSGVELVGVATAGFAVFAPVALILSLNLRTSVAISLLQEVTFGFLFLLRLAMSILAILIAAVVAWIVAPDSTLALAATLLLTTKFVDNLADLIFGFYQRENQMGRTALSLVARAVALFAAIAASVVGQISELVFCALTALLYASSFVLFDLIKSGLSTGAGSAVGAGAQHSVGNTLVVIRKNWISALFPVVDNLHQNSLRIGTTLFFGIETVGLVGLALAAYAPMQLLVTAAGMKVLPHLRRRWLQKDHVGFCRVLWSGMLFGFGIALITVLAAVLTPASLYAWVFNANGEAARRVTVIIGLAHLLLPMSGFISQSLITSDRPQRYLAAPAISVALFWATMGTAYLLGPVDFIQLSVTAFLASALRVWLSWGRKFDTLKVFR